MSSRVTIAALASLGAMAAFYLIFGLYSIQPIGSRHGAVTFPVTNPAIASQRPSAR